LNQLLSDTEIASFSADQMGAAIMQDVASFEAGQEPSDDQTLLVLKWHGK
jgi:serine phosphatase RsbU (regulator of sigma subunit)